MKTFYILFISLFMSNYIKAETVQGYYISLNNDTILAKIKLPKALLGGLHEDKLYTRLEIEDSSENVITFKPTELKGYGFTYKENTFHFISKLGLKKVALFVQVIARTSNTNLYTYWIPNLYGNVGVPCPIVNFYIFEKSDGQNLFITPGTTTKKLKEKLGDFYNDSETIGELTERIFGDKNDAFKSTEYIEQKMRDFVHELSKL